MDINRIIEKAIQRKGYVKLTEIAKATGFSRTYIHRFFKALCRDGKLALIGKANRAHYVPATKRELQKVKENTREVHRLLSNKGLSEDIVLEEIKEGAGIFLGLPQNVARIVDYAFTEMLNNAIEHSQSKKISVRMRRTQKGIEFKIVDRGIGIFKNIATKRGLANELEAIQDLLKGKQTTDPERHTGEGIFFTSKVVTWLAIKGSNKQLIFDNALEDLFIKNIRPIVGTDVNCTVDLQSRKDLSEVFAEYTGEEFEFAKTNVTVELYTSGNSFMSRSQARRIMSGLEKFKVIVLDFKRVETVGQAFADEVFRVWQHQHPRIRIESWNVNDNVRLMIERAREHRNGGTPMPHRG